MRYGKPRISPDGCITMAAQLGVPDSVSPSMGTSCAGMRLRIDDGDARDAQVSAPCALCVPMERRKHYARGVCHCTPAAMRTVRSVHKIHALARAPCQMGNNKYYTDTVIPPELQLEGYEPTWSTDIHLLRVRGTGPCASSRLRPPLCVCG